MFTDSRKVGKNLRRGVRPVVLVVSLGVSAFITEVVLRSPDVHWLAWFCFLPLFVAVQSLRPMRAALSGGLWGACLYLFSSAGATYTVDTVVPAVGPSAWLLGLLIVVPAVYVGLAARPARAIGFKLLTLALGWTLIEVALVAAYPNNREPRAEWMPDLSGAHAVLQSHDASAGPHQDLLVASQGEAPHLHWLARLLGYVCMAVIVACANASLVGLLSRARLSFPAYRSLAGSPDVVGWLPSQAVLPIQLWILRQAHPRAPPMQGIPVS